MNKSGIGFLAAVAAGIAGVFVFTHNANAKPPQSKLSGRPSFGPFRVSTPPFTAIPAMSMPASQGVKDLQAALVSFLADPRNPILAPSGARVLFDPAAVTGTFDLPTMTAIWAFEQWNNANMINDPQGIELDTDGMPTQIVLDTIQRYNSL